jgi:oligoribonuclease (3'-5' exoribonuclease)
MSSSHDELLTDEQIKSIHDQLVIAFKDDTNSLVEMILNNWLAEDKNMLWANIDELITQARKGELLTIDQINNILNEDSYDNN